MKDNYVAAMSSIQMPETCGTRIRTVLESREETVPRRRGWVRTGAVLAAAALLLAGSAVAAVWRVGVLEIFFQGDASVLEPYVQNSVDTVSDGTYQLSVDSYLFDGESAYIVITVQGLTEQAIQDLKSNWTLARTHLEFWGQDMVDYLMERGRSGPDTFHVSETWYQSVQELPAPDTDSRSWRIKADTPREELTGQPLELWVDFMGKDYEILLPVDTEAASVTLFPDMELTTQDGRTAILKELTLKSTGVSYVVRYTEKVDDPFHEFEFQLRLGDGTVLTQKELGTRLDHGETEDWLGDQYRINDLFLSPADLSQVEAVIVNGVEIIIPNE